MTSLMILVFTLSQLDAFGGKLLCSATLSVSSECTDGIRRWGTILSWSKESVDDIETLGACSPYDEDEFLVSLGHVDNVREKVVLLALVHQTL